MTGGAVAIRRSRGSGTARPHPWRWFGAWALAGGAYAAGIAGAASIGIVVFPVAIVATVVLLGRRTTLIGLPGAALGVGAVLFYLTYVNRHGPGTVCAEVAGSGAFRCVAERSPWPFLAAGLFAVVLSLVVFVVLRQRRVSFRG